MRKMIASVAMLVVAAVLFSCGNNKTASSNGENNMKVTSVGIVNGVIDDKYGVNNQDPNTLIDKVPSISVPLTIEGAPAETVSYAIVLEDKDAFPVSQGFSWIHWTAANIKNPVIPENASRSNPDFVQGVNSWWSPINGLLTTETDPKTGETGNRLTLEQASFFGGMAPPLSGQQGGGPHTYEFHVYALDIELDLQDGFWMNDLYKAMKGHILAEYTLTGTYERK